MNIPVRAFYIASLALFCPLMSACGVNQNDELRVVVMPEALGAAWAQDQAKVEPSTKVDLSGNKPLVAGIDVSCLMEDELRTFDCNASIEGNEIHLDLEVRTRKGTDDCRGGFRRLCPIGVVPPGDYEVHALGQQINIAVPSKVSADSLMIPPMPPPEEAEESAL